MTIHFTVGQIQKASLDKMSYFPEPYNCSKNRVNVELYLANYVTKSDLRNSTVVDTLDFAKGADLASLK